MKLSELIPAEAVKHEMAAVTKREAIRELVQILVACGRIPSEQSGAVLRALMKREERGSTGIGRGIAVPHLLHAAAAKSVGSLGRSSRGVAFHSLDGEPAHLLFLIASPESARDDHVKALQKVSLLARDADMCRFLKRARTDAEMVDLLKEADERLGA